jgi:hypothetical protein
MRAVGALLCATAIVAASCRSRESPKPEAIHPIDKIYLRYKETRQWVDPADESKSYSPEGLQSFCKDCDYMCLQNMHPVGDRLPIRTDADLLPLVRWLHDDDNCVRAAAADALWPRLGVGVGGRSVSVEDRESYTHHELASALKIQLDKSHVKYDRKIFEPLMLGLSEKDFPVLLSGNWAQPITNDSWQMLVTIESQTIRLTKKFTHPDPNWPDQTSAHKVKELRVNEKDQFVIQSDELPLPDQTSGKGAQTKTRRAERQYVFWPVAKDVVWFQYSNGPFEVGRHWTKLKRKR